MGLSAKSRRQLPRTVMPGVQPPIGRPVCAAPCVLLMGHPGSCIASNGRKWTRT